MIDLSNILQGSEHVLKRKLSLKPESAVLLMERPGGGPVMLRVYDQEVPAYQMLVGRSCQYLPQVYRAGEIAGLFVVEEEYIDGVSLLEMISGGYRFDVQRTIALSLKICSALDFLHASGFIHRDVKPEHVLLTEGDGLALIDLDASMKILPDKKNDTQLIGTAMYAAPEQFGITRSDARTDVYAMGLLMNEMLTGVHPTVKQYREGRLGKIIEKCTRINPEDRYQSITELAEALHSAEVEVRLGGTKQSRTKSLAVCAAVCVLALFLAGGLLINHSLSEGNGKTELDAPAYEEGTQWLQLYKYERMETDAFAYREGSQSAKYFTQDGTEVDQTFHVYADESIGVVTGWDEEHGAWNLCSEGCEPGITGYLHAEKDGKHYAIEVLVMGEGMSAYRELPDQRDFMKGYLPAYTDPDVPGKYFIDSNYSREEPVILYLAAMRGLDTLTPSCRSDLVGIRLYEEDHLWDGPVYELTFQNPEGGDAVFQVESEYHSLTFCMTEEVSGKEPEPEKQAQVKPESTVSAEILQEKTEPPENENAARVEGTDYLQLYKEGQRDTVYFNFRTGSQSAPLFTEEGIRVDETWKVYADRQVGIIEVWNTRYKGWTLRSEGCQMGASGYIHAEKDGKHYAILVRVMGEPMSAYSKLPALADYTDGYIQPKVYPDLMRQEMIRMTYTPGQKKQIFLVAMEGFRNLQPVCSSSLVTIEPFDGALAWDEPVFTMTFDNPDGGDALIEVGSNHTSLLFYFEEV